MTHNDLDHMIQEFREIIPPQTNPFGMFFTRHDWRPVWSLAKMIQEGFDSKVRYPSHDEHQSAWNRFNELRNLANSRAKDERSWLETKSNDHRNSILGMCKSLGWTPLEDMTNTILFLGATTIDDMKDRQQRLGQAMKELKERKHEMLAVHKQECFERFQQVKEEQEDFWRRYREAREVNREKFEAGREAFRSRVSDNLEKNRSRLEKTQEALTRFREKVADLENKVDDESASVKWRGIWAEWLADAKVRMANIEEQVERLENWIDEDKRKLSEID